MNHRSKSGNGGSGWGGFYANKKQADKDRYAELDSSSAVAINIGSQPTLAKRRRQLADEKWGSKGREVDGDTIFRDLVSSHATDTSGTSKLRGGVTNDSKSRNDTKLIKATNPMLINARKSFWKRKLSDLSTKDFGIIWKEGRNKFLKHINNISTNNKHDSESITAAVSTSSSASPGSKDDRHGLKNPPSTGVDKNSKVSGDASASPSGSYKNDRSVKSITRGQLSTAAAAAAAAATATRTIPSRNHNVIDLCDSDSEDDVVDDYDNRRNVDSTAGLEGGDEKDQEQEEIPKTEAIVDSNETIQKKHPRELPPKAAATEATSSPSIPIASTITTAANPKTTTESRPLENRWSKLFLGPDFRTEFVFSIDEDDF